MILIGQYDSPFVRRVAVALRLYGLEYEHRPWSVFGDAEKIAALNPLRRVPTFVADDGEALLESGAILDWLDDLVGPDRALIARSGPERRHALKVAALATGLADKAVSLVYERVVHQRGTPMWVERSTRWRPTERPGRARGGSASASATRTSSSAASCVSWARPCLRSMHPPTGRRSPPTLPPARPCRSSKPSCSPST